jgi:DNA segregation ATPase FtsK/SpoIIIE, S-DNA-T family
MIIEVLSTALMGSIAGYSYLQKETNDVAKLQKIFKNCGLVVTEKNNGEKVIRQAQIYRRSKILNEDNKMVGNEYVFRIPLGLSLSDFEKKNDAIRDGLNNKKQVVSIDDFKSVNFKENIPQQIKALRNKKSSQKEVEMSFDGMLKIKVYNQPMSDYLEYERMKKDGWKVPMGIDRLGKIIFHDFDNEYYMLIAGAIGGGKSNAANLIISHLLYTQGDNLSMSLIDLKDGIEFGCYKDCKQVVGYADKPQDVPKVLEKIQTFIHEMKKKVKKKGYRNVIEAGIKERHFLIIDEIAELSPDEETDKALKEMKQKIWNEINHLARLGRAWGLRIISATQHPIQECIPKYLKRNSEGRLCFPVEDAVASRVVLGTIGAESLPEINGRALYKKGANLTEIQVYRILNETIDEAIKPNLKKKVRGSIADIKRNEGGGDTLIDEETWLS